jgi:hypothetical protein
MHSTQNSQISLRTNDLGTNAGSLWVQLPSGPCVQKSPKSSRLNGVLPSFDTPKGISQDSLGVFSFLKGVSIICDPNSTTPTPAVLITTTSTLPSKKLRSGVFYISNLAGQIRKFAEWGRLLRQMASSKSVLPVILSLAGLLFSPLALAETATWYSMKSVLAEGNTGITASGEKFSDTALTCAMRSRNFGKFYKVTNLSNGRSVKVKHTDYGPNKKQSQKGVVVDLSPAAFEALGAKFGYTKTGIPYGEIQVKVEAL